ncbi:peroxisomal acyl-CoA-dehydrogenase [Laetiporus sulphureus 93-53]|uniref:Peroxisomal acyl-CoA-dehydrogenase n=1 Tax=Laetiporus sulphureus 93-53 TaxID=1314785 RepID=A0A165ES33_9APHY|nr:peroxisomal acyl-CoA-dehydrogenase [Laetiporus sulphureus 93-53]KZT07648.1 peroxisomal acyl-CoA-dehydrogenase [Laetiporus sulphureus 93-53]
MASKELKSFTREEVAKHNTESNLWIIIDSKVYDVTRFRNMHPGGASVLLEEGIPGEDATEAFYSLHRHEVLERPQYKRLQIGYIQGEEPQIVSTINDGAISKVPYAEPTWLVDGYHSPYYTESHRRFHKAVRKFMDDVVYPDAQAREADGKRPSQLVFDKMAELELHAMRMGPGKHLKGRTLMNGLVKPEEFDYFHELIISQEVCRCGARGYGDGLNAGCVIGLPPVLNFGSPELKARVVPEVLSGKKFICLAISEAQAGSDVFGLQTTATKTEDGKHWIVNGTKKWITNGMWADYFTVGCKTEDGFTVILVERQEGVETKPIKTAYSPTAGTSFVTFDNVKVPVENMLGEEGGGIFVILSNFNHERWVMCCTSARSQRSVVEECLKWTTQRKAFGKPLNSQAVVRAKLAGMIARVESIQSWLENITHQMNNMSYKEQANKLAGPIALLKMYSTRSAQETATDAVQIFGGRGVTQTGMGRFIEHYHRTIAFDALLGGAEDVLADLGVRQAMRSMPKNARL